MCLKCTWDHKHKLISKFMVGTANNKYEANADANLISHD